MKISDITNEAVKFEGKLWILFGKFMTSDDKPVWVLRNALNEFEKRVIIDENTNVEPVQTIYTD